MGASLVIRTFPDMPEKDLLEHINQARSRDGYEHGHGYSGSWSEKNGCDFERDGLSHTAPVKTFESVRAAEEHISEHNDKWGPLTAVRAKVIEVRLPDGKVASTGSNWGPEIPRGKKVIELDARVEVAAQALKAFVPAVIARVKAGKSKTKGCGHCGSSIATSHICSTDCPVCGQPFLLTETDRAKLGTLKAKLKKLQADAAAARKAELDKLATKHSKTVWVVGGWCSS